MHNAAARLPAAMTDHPLLSAEEERAAFARLHEARVAAWLAVLGDRHHAPRCLPANTPGLAEHVVWDAAREAAVMRPVRAHLDAAAWYARPLAERLAADDPTLDALHAAVAVVGRLAPRRSTSSAWVQQVGQAMRDLAAAIAHVECHNARLVVARATRFAKMAGPFELADLVAYGFLGLRLAVLKFDATRNFRFSTMATMWIDHPIRRAIQDGKTTIRIPVHLQERLAKVARLQREHRAVTGEDLSVEQLAERLPGENNLGRAIDILRGQCTASSLDAPLTDEAGGPTLADVLPDPNAQAQDDAVHDAERRGLAARLLDVLDDRERLVVERRFGFGDGEEARLDDLAGPLGITRERVRQIQKNAMRRLEAAARRLTRARPDALPTAVAHDSASTGLQAIVARRQSMQQQVSLQW